MIRPETNYAELLAMMENEAMHEDARQEEIRAQVEFSMAQGNEFDPLEEDNLREALGELMATKDGISTIGVALGHCLDSHAQAQLLVFLSNQKLRKLVFRYWEKIARKEAEKSI